MAWRRLEASSCFANDFKASWRRLKGVLECFGGGSGLPGRVFLALGHDIGFIVDFLSIFSSLEDQF